MNFNLDDPLADLLSDNSLSNDNFFEQSASSAQDSIKKQNASTAATTTQQKTRRMEDLFGIKEDPELEAEQQQQRIQPGLRSSGILAPTPIKKSNILATSTPRIRTTKPSLDQLDFSVDLDAEQDDDNDDLGFDPKAPKTSNTTSSQNFDDWLSIIDASSKQQQQPQRPSTATGTGRRKEEKPLLTRQSTADTTTDNSNLLNSQARPKTATGRRSSAQSTMLSQDPLNLFSNSGQSQKTGGGGGSVAGTISDMSSPQARKRNNTADWLGLTVDSRDQQAQQQQHSQQQQETHMPPEQPRIDSTTYRQPKSQVDLLNLAESQETQSHNAYETQTDEEKPTGSQDLAKSDTTAQSIMMLGSMQLGTKLAIDTLNQQEQQLQLAKQMQAQELTLLEMKRRQESVLQQQERQFQSLLQQQVMRQQQMEDNIKLQQQRINAHIQLLMTQPQMFGGEDLTIRAGDSDDYGLRESNTRLSKSEQDNAEQQQQQDTSGGGGGGVNAVPSMQEVAAMEMDIRRLELEKGRLEDLVESMKVNYDKEMDLVVTSYKKQLEFLEQHSATMEERLRLENTELKAHFTQKLQDLEAEHSKYKSEVESLAESQRADHEDEVRKLRRTHEQDLDLLRDEHQRMLERIRQTKLLEFASVQEGGSYMDTLRAATTNLASLSDGLQGLRDEMQTKLDALHAERTQKLDARERRIEDAERRLKTTEQAAEEEKARLLDLVSTLELQLNKLSKDSAEENWQLRTKMASLEAEKAAFEREKEYSREQQLRDEKRLEELKELQLAEQKRKLLDLQEERMKIIAERSKIEAERKLLSNTDFEQQRIEIEAQFNVAQNAIKQADAERERYHKMQRQLEQQKRALSENESLLTLKENELENELSSYRIAESKAQTAMQKAKQTEQVCLAKMQTLQKHMRELAERETQLSQERLLLTQDRIAVHNMRTRLSQRKCVLCKMASEQEEENDLLANQFQQQQQQLHNYQPEQQIRPPVNLQMPLPPTVSAPGGGGAVPNVAAGANVGSPNVEPNQTDFVERLLDDNIQESFRRMKATNAANVGMEFWNESGLDDDSKKLAAMHTMENDLDNSMFE